MAPSLVAPNLPVGERTVVEWRQQVQELPPLPTPWKHPLRAVFWLINVAWGLICLIALLAILAAIPLVNLLVAGFLMEVQARVARTGKLRSAFYLLPAAQRLAGVLLAIWLWLLPIQFLSAMARDSWLLGPGSFTAWLWAIVLIVCSLLIASHLLFAVACGGSWWRFFRPISNIRWLLPRWRGSAYWQAANESISEFLAAFQLMRLLRLGLFGFVAAYLWLALPALLFTMMDDVTSRWQVVMFVMGGVMLTLMLMWLPLLLAHVAVENRFRAIVEIGKVHKLACQTPFRWAIATAILFACSVLPLLYTALIKNQLPPHDARWDLMLVFLVAVVPGRVLIGWVYHRATRQQRSRRSWPWRIWQLGNCLALWVGIAYYVYFLYLAQTGGELGQRAVWQYHALLLPLPF
jgi:hypothetical protein